MSNNLIYAPFRVHAPFTVTVIYRLCSSLPWLKEKAASLCGGGSDIFCSILGHKKRHIKAYFTCFLTLSSSVWFEKDASPGKTSHLLFHLFKSLVYFSKWLKLYHQIYDYSWFHLVNIIWRSICNPSFNPSKRTMTLVSCFISPLWNLSVV